MRLLFVFMLSLYAAAGSAQTLNLNIGGALSDNYYAEIPYRMVKGKIIIPVMIGGKIRQFVLDTGAPNTLSEELAGELGAPSRYRVSLADANGKMDSVSVAVMDTLTVGSIAFGGVPALVVSNSMVFGCIGAEGIIGSNMLRNSVLRINSRSGTVTIASDAGKMPLHKKDRNALFLTPAQSNPYFRIELNGKGKAQEQLLFDSGDDGLYSCTPAHLALFQKNMVFDGVDSGFGGNAAGFHGFAANATVYRVQIPQVRINAAILHSVTGYSTNDDNSRIGAGLLRYGVVTVDYKHRYFYFEAFTGDTTLQLPRWPYSPTFSDGYYAIGIVWDKSMAEIMKQGDRIISIDGVRYDAATICDLIGSAPLEGKTSAVVTLQGKDGVMRTVTIMPK